MSLLKLEIKTTFSKDDTAYVKLNRPDLKNAFNAGMIAELTDVFGKLSIDKNIKLLIISGEGKSFCAGADLSWMQSMINFDYIKNLNDSERLNEMFLALYNLPIPVLTLVQGHAFGGALGLIAASDIVIATENTEFAFSEVRLGLVPAVISPYVLQKIGFSQASRFLVSGESFGSQKALQLGLIHELCAEIDLSKAADKIRDSILQMAPQAVKATKKLVREMAPIKMDKKIFDLTTDLIAKIRVSEEGQEGLKSFLAKQNPSWRKS